MFPCPLSNHIMESIFRDLSCLERGLKTCSLPWEVKNEQRLRKTSMSGVQRLWSESCVLHSSDGPLGSGTELLLVLCWVGAGGRELGSCSCWWFRALLPQSKGRETSIDKASWDLVLFFLRFPSLVGKANMRESRVIFPSLVCDSHWGAAEHMQQGGWCVDGAKVPSVFEQVAHYQWFKFLLAFSYCY